MALKVVGTIFILKTAVLTTGLYSNNRIASVRFVPLAPTG